MKSLAIIAACVLVASLTGCSGVSQVERENLVDIASREDYVQLNPGGLYNDNIRNGEITRGMDGHEVMASWGLPNVYFVSRLKMEEYWVYYVEDQASSSILIYTLTFDDGNMLTDWDIDMKRLTDNSVVYNPEQKAEENTATTISKKK